jgi:hypothetical protein
MKRGEHTFQFSGKQIADAAKAEHDYHAERLAWWRSQEEEAVKDAEAAGVQVRQQAVTGGRRVVMVVDVQIQDRLNLCGQKIDSHRNAADRFQIEAAAYGTHGNSTRTYELHPDDVLYFRLAGGARED